MSTLNIQNPEGRSTFHPGEEIDLVADWQLENEVEAVEVRLVWYTRGKGDTDFSLVKTERFESPGFFETKQFRFQLPESPYSFSGQLISLIWALELIVIPSGESTRSDITIAPQAQEVLLRSSGEFPQSGDETSQWWGWGSS